MTAEQAGEPGMRVAGDKDVEKMPSRAVAAVKLRVYGASYAEIAETLGYAEPSLARKAVEYSLGRSGGEEGRDNLRKIMWQRLDRMARAALKKGLDDKHPEQLAALRTALAITDRQLRLRGLDDPAQVAVYTPAHGEIEAFVAEVMAARMSQLPPEADIVEADVLDPAIEASP